MVELVRKISSQTVLGGAPEAPKPGATKWLMQVFGLTKDATVQESQYGEYIRFRGRFQAVNKETGELVESATMILPEPGAGMLYAALASMEDRNGTVEFALEVGVKGDEASVTKYQWTARPLIEPEESDQLAQLRQKLKIALPNPSQSAAG